MDCSNSCPDALDAEPRRTFKNPFGEMDKTVQFWGEARGESRKISIARLKCAPHSDLAESLAMVIWERMTPEHYRLVSDIDRLLVAHEEIRLAVLREMLGQIFGSLNLDIKELRAIHPVPIEAVTLLLKHIIKIYNMDTTDVQTGEELVPLSERIKEQANRAEKHGFGSIKLSKNMYVSERAELAMLQTQLLGRLKLKSGTGAKFQDEWRKLKFKSKESCKKDQSKRKLRKILEIREKLKEAQETLGSAKSRSITYKTGKLRRYASRLSKAESHVTNSNHSLSTVNQDTSVENLTSGVEDGTPCPDDINSSMGDDPSLHASIDTSSWVISPTHEYYFGSSPPVIPKTTVTHEVYPKPVESKIMEPVECVDDTKIEVQGDGREISREVSKLGTMDLESSKSAMAESETSGLNSRFTSTTSSASLTNVDYKKTADCDESHGDASTIFAWTEPEKSASYCLNTGEKTVDTTMEDLVTEVSDAAGDGCDLARTLEESNMDVLMTDDQEIHEFSSGIDDSPEVPPPRPFSMTDILDTDGTTSNESIGFYKRNLFSCNESMLVQGTNEFIWQPDVKRCGVPLEIQAVSLGNPQRDLNGSVFVTEEPKDVRDNEEPHNTKQEKIFDKPPAEPNVEVACDEEKTDDSRKKRSLGVQLANKNVMDELTVVLRRSSISETASGSSASTSQDLSGRSSLEMWNSFPKKESNSDRNEVLSSGDSVLKIADATKSEYASNFAIPVPPPMPPPPTESEESCEIPCYGDVYPQRSVDDFQSATDFRGTQVLYMRPPSARQRSEKKKTPQRSSVNRQENESDGNQTSEAPSGREATPGKRNDMVTLAVLAFAVGFGTLGYMTMAATGSNLFPEVVGVAGGRALNMIEKALQVLKTLNNRL